MTGREMELLASTVREGLAKGQSVHHVFASRDDLPCSERSFYRRVENEAIDVSKMELRKKVRHKKRRRAKAAARDDGALEGRTHDDYLALDVELRARTVWMDCVEGAAGDSQAVLTLHFVGIRFQIYILLERKDSEHVVAALDWLESLVGGPEAFGRVFGLILADRGPEFADTEGIEGGGRCSLYYADPMRADRRAAARRTTSSCARSYPRAPR